MAENLTNQTKTVFEQLKQLDEGRNEFWLARHLGSVLEYSEFRHFKPVIKREKEACKARDINELDHFENVLDMVSIGSGAERELKDVRLSRYACY